MQEAAEGAPTRSVRRTQPEIGLGESADLGKIKRVDKGSKWDTEGLPAFLIPGRVVGGI